MLLDVPDLLPVPGQEDNSGALQVLAMAREERDRYTDVHCERVSRLAHRLGQRCDLNPQQLANLALAARFHDVGKISVRDNVLLHPGRLDENRMASMRTHARSPWRCSSAIITNPSTAAAIPPA